MSAIAERGVAPRARPAEQRKERKDRKRRIGSPFAGGIAWIVVVGALLAGIVAVNVLVLQLNMQFDGLSRQRAQLKADNALLRSQLSSASANVRIEEAATSQLGLQAADPLTTTYVRLRAK
jgi:cell division protein FtsL